MLVKLFYYDYIVWAMRKVGLNLHSKNFLYTLRIRKCFHLKIVRTHTQSTLHVCGQIVQNSMKANPYGLVYVGGWPSIYWTQEFLSVDFSWVWNLRTLRKGPFYVLSVSFQFLFKFPIVSKRRLFTLLWHTILGRPHVEWLVFLLALEIWSGVSKNIYISYNDAKTMVKAFLFFLDVKIACKLQLVYPDYSIIMLFYWVEKMHIFNAY